MFWISQVNVLDITLQISFWISGKLFKFVMMLQLNVHERNLMLLADTPCTLFFSISESYVFSWKHRDLFNMTKVLCEIAYICYFYSLLCLCLSFGCACLTDSTSYFIFILLIITGCIVIGCYIIVTSHRCTTAISSLGNFGFGFADILGISA